MECVTLPVELIEIILSLAWMLPLETEERVQFMLASTLVSTTSYIPHLQKMLLASVPETRTFACHSISLVLDFAKPASQASPADSYSSFLTHLKSHELPKLQDISIEFANANLQLKWASSPSPLTTTTSSTCGPPRGKLFLPTISTARITGGSADLVVMVVSACWNLLGLQISSNDGKNSGESEIGSSKGAERRKGMTKNLCETGTQMTVFKDGFIGYATVLSDECYTHE